MTHAKTQSRKEKIFINHKINFAIFASLREIKVFAISLLLNKQIFYPGNIRGLMQNRITGNQFCIKLPATC